MFQNNSQPTSINTVKLSVVTPCFNGERYIERCVNSVLSHGDPNIEHIIVDGMSNDATPKILKRLADQYKPRLQIIREPDNSMTEALCKGIGAATGKWIAPLNADDFYLSLNFSKLLEILLTTAVPML